MAFALLIAFAGWSTVEGADPAAEPKDHAIFIGLNLIVDNAHATGEVQDVSRSSAEIATDQGLQTVPIRSLLGVRTRRLPKLSDTILAISDLRGERTFTRANDPTRMALDQARTMEFLRGQQTDIAEGNLMHANAALTTNELDHAQAEQMQGELRQEMEQTLLQTSGQMYSPGATVQNSGKNSGGSEDAFEVAFTLTAPDTIEDAYGVLVLQVHYLDRPGVPVTNIAFQRLPTLGAKPRRLTLSCSGIPPGFVVDAHEIHIYRKGEELASNLSDKSVAVTRGEAHQFRLIQYLLEHKADNLPPEVARDFLPSDFRERVPADALNRSAEVHVDRDGRVTAVKLDGSTPQPTDAYIESVLRDTLFYPALTKGEPVETDTTIVLSELAR